MTTQHRQRVRAKARRRRDERRRTLYREQPYVCPDCYAVNEPCALDCPERRRRELQDLLDRWDDECGIM